MTRNQTIYTILRNSGLTEAGAIGMMGNWDCESNLEPGRLQGDFSSFRTTSKNYVQRATDGSMSKEEFCRAIGFGLAQWTLPYRKGKLWDFWKSYGTALDSEILQTFFALKELQTEGEYAGLFRMLKESDNLLACTEAICKQYERPAVNNVDARYSSAMRLQQSLSGFAVDPAAYVEYVPAQGSGNADSMQPTVGATLPTQQTPSIMPTHEYWPPRVICEGMKGTDVEVLRALLKAQEYGVNYIDSNFGSFLTERVKAYQTDHGLKPDGIVGPLTWAALLKITKF